MTPQEFVNKWTGNALLERSAAQQHFLDLCALFEHPTPAAVDKLGEEFTFERGLTKTGGGSGFADVWKRGFFAFEYKKQKRSLDAALEQLTRYASALENPPLHVACDTQLFKIVTAWTNLVPVVYELSLQDLLDPEKRRILWNVFHDPDALRPGQTRERLTRDAAEKFLVVADRLNHRNPDREAVAHFINQLVFCFFAEDVKLLPEGYFTRLLRNALRRPVLAKSMLDDLFAAMQHGGPHGIEVIEHFNGGLFDDRRAFPLQEDELRILIELGRLDWDLIDPTIFGTLFERFLDPGKRKQIGAHYTPPDKIMQIVEPVIVRPLQHEWDEAKARITGLLDGSVQPPKSERTTGRIRPMDAAIGERERFLERLRGIRVLDPACGSGNFLYLALHAIKDIENRALLETEALGLPPQPPIIDPEILHGIEINPVAAELARTTIWIGYIQWEIRNMVGVGQRPILKRLDTIECRDALVKRISAKSQFPSHSGGEGQGEGALTAVAPSSVGVPIPPAGEGGASAPGKGAATYVEAEWPDAEFIVGNPPFLGGKRLIGELGADYAETIRSVYDGRVSRFSDLVCWWFEKSRTQIAAGKAKRAGLVATNSIRGGRNRQTLDRISTDLTIFEAWSDEPWVVEGAAVRVSIVCFGEVGTEVRLNGVITSSINTDLTSSTDLTKAKRLEEARNVAFIGVQKSGPLDLLGTMARHLLSAPLNVNGRSNSDVLRPWANGLDVVRQPRDRWIIDFGDRTAAEAAQYEGVWRRLLDAKNGYEARRGTIARSDYWRLWRSRPELAGAVVGKSRVLVVPEVSKHRAFVWLAAIVRPDKNLTVIARDDDTTFGTLHSRFHEAWSLRLGTWLGVGNDPRYTPTTTFETFPFPEGLTPNIPAVDYAADPRAIRIASAAKELDDKRRAWLNPPDLVDIVPEIVPTTAPGEAPAKYPDRILPKSEEAAEILKTRTLTKLYNERPQWLSDLHDTLDRAVAAAYGWPEDISTDEALERLLALNLERAAAGR